MFSGKSHTPFDDFAETEVERAMRVLGTSVPIEEFHPSVLVKELEAVIEQKIESTEKIKQIQSLVKSAKDRAEHDRQQALLRSQVQELTKAKQAYEQQRSRAKHKKVDFTPAPSGLYISAEDVNRHPMLRCSWNARMLLLMFGMFLVIEPFFIALTNDVQTLSIVFFVVTIFFAVFEVYYIVETREQELRMFLGNDENAMMLESREPSWTMSTYAFIGAMFVQLVYALLSARAPVSTLWVVLIVFVSCALLFISYGFMVTFENKYQLSH